MKKSKRKALKAAPPASAPVVELSPAQQDFLKVWAVAFPLLTHGDRDQIMPILHRAIGRDGAEKIVGQFPNRFTFYTTKDGRVLKHGALTFGGGG